MPNRLIHVLLVFDHDVGELLRERTFEISANAVSAYAEAEREYRDRDRIEVVLIGSDSVETIRRTHANYYDGTVATSEFLAGL